MADRPGPAKKAATKVEPPFAAAPRRRRRPPRVRRTTLAVALVSGLATLYGLAFDRSLRADPFGAPENAWEWLTTRQPDRALRTVEVVPMGARGELSWRPRETRWVFAEAATLIPRASAPPGAPAPFPGPLQQCFAPQNLYCPIDAARAATPAPETPPSPAKSNVAPAGPAAPQLIKAAFVGEQGKEPPQDPKQAYIPPSAEQDIKAAPVQGPPPVVSRPRNRPTPRPAAPATAKPAPAAPATPPPEPSPTPAAAEALYEPSVPSSLQPLAGALTAVRLPGEPSARTGAACARDGRVCVLTGPAVSGYTIDGGRRFYRISTLLRATPQPLVAATAPAGYVVQGVVLSDPLSTYGVGSIAQGRVDIRLDPFVLRDVLGLSIQDSGGTLATVRTGAFIYGGRLAPSPAPHVMSMIQRVGGLLVHSGWTDDPMLALAWSLPQARERMMGGACYEFAAGPDAPAQDERALCVGLFTEGRLLFHLQGGEVFEEEAWQATLQTDADPSSVFFLDAQRGFVSTLATATSPPQIFATRDGGRTWKPLRYGAWPAPWVYAAAPIFLFSFAGAAGALLRRPEDPQSGIETAGVADTPIGWRDADPLNLKPVAMALSRFVRNSQTKPPLTIAVSGIWGSGKSSLMNLVYEDLKARRVRPVWFNAWHHQKEEHLLAALLENVRSQATPPLWAISGLNYRWRLLRHRPREIANALVFSALILGVAAVLLVGGLKTLGLEDIVNTARALAPQLGLPAGIAGVFALLALARSLADRMGVNPSALLASLKGRNSSLGELSNQLSFRHRFAEEFRDATQALRVGSDAGLVIFIDDLDRCSPENLMEVLEAVNFLATAGPCFIFLGMDERRVVKAIATQPPISSVVARGGDEAAAQEQARLYLRKLINVTVPVPPASLEGTLGLVDGEAPPPRSPWPDRLRRWTRAAPDVVAIPAALALLLAWMGVQAFEAKQRLDAQAPPQAATPATAPSPTGPTASEGLPSGPADQGGTPGGPTDAGVPPAGPTDLGGTPSGPVALDRQAVAPPAETAPAWLLTLLAVSPFALAILIAVLLLARRAVVAAYDEEEDSAGFREALRIWHPVVYEVDATPRGVKRHQNRLRLQAMRLRPVQEPDDWLDRLVGRPRTEPRSAPKAKPIGDEMLVALSALQQAGDDVLERGIRNTLDVEPPPDRAELMQEAADALTWFRGRFRDAWPPSEDQLRAFRDLNRTFGDDESA